MTSQKSLSRRHFQPCSLDHNCQISYLLSSWFEKRPSRLGLSTLTSFESLFYYCTQTNWLQQQMHCESHKVSGSGTDRTFFWNEDQSSVSSAGAWRCTEYSWIRDICQLLDSVRREGGRWHLSPNCEGWASNREVSKHPKSKCMGALSWLRGYFVLSGVENKRWLQGFHVLAPMYPMNHNGFA